MNAYDLIHTVLLHLLDKNLHMNSHFYRIGEVRGLVHEL